MKIRRGMVHLGAAGSALELLCDPSPEDPIDWRSGIGNWFIDAPGQSIAWRHYLLTAIHLRPIEGVKPAVIVEPGATHEFIVVALNPEKHPTPENNETWSFLTPFNMVQQVKLRDDAAASKLLGLAAYEVARGDFLWAEPPLSGQVEPWRSFLRADRS